VEQALDRKVTSIQKTTAATLSAHWRYCVAAGINLSLRNSICAAVAVPEAPLAVSV